MSPSTRAKNANQHPGHILLADTKKRRTKEEIAADNKKKHLEKKTTEAALHRLYEYIAGEEDHLAEDEVNAHKKKFPPSLFPQPLDHQNAPIRWDSDNECEVDANTKQDKNTIDLGNDEALEAFQVGNSDNEAEGGGGKVMPVPVMKKRKTGAYDTIQAMRKRPNVDTQVILKTAAGLPKNNQRASEGGATSEKKITSDKPSGLLNVKLWTTSVAKPRVTRDRALTFGPGTRDWSSVTAPDSCATSVSSTTAPTPSTRTTSNGLQSETEPAGLPTYGGLEDEKGSLEDIRSVLGKRGSSAMAVKVEDSGIPHSKRRSGRVTHTQAEGSKRPTKYTNSDLPKGALENNDWRKKFITTYEKWLGARAGPWINDEDENVTAMQAIWNTVYPHINHTIEVDGPVYYIAQQRASEWRSAFGSNAVAMFKAAFEGGKFSAEDKLSTAVQLLEKSAFLYAEPNGETQKEYRGLFRSPWILQLFASHYDSISGAIRVPALEPSFSCDQLTLINILEDEVKSLDPDSEEALTAAIKIDTMRMYPMGALAICTVAVERAITLIAAPADNASAASADTFSRKWNKLVRKYREIIKAKLQDGSMEDIISKACRYMKSGTNISASVALPDYLEDDMMDEDLDMYADL